MSNEHNNAPVPEWDNKAYMTAIAGLRVKYGISHAMADLYYESWVELVRHSQKLEEQIARMNEHNNAPAVPQGAIGWIPKWAFARLTGELGGKADPVTWGLHAPIYAKAPGACDGVAIYATPSPAPAQYVGLTEAERVRCLIASGCIGTVKMTYDSGPYEITRTSINASRLIDAIIAALRAKGAV